MKVLELTGQEEAMSKIPYRRPLHLGVGVCVCDDHDCWRHRCWGLCSALQTMNQMHQCHYSDAAATIEDVDGNLPTPKSTTEKMVEHLRRLLEFTRHERVVWQVSRGSSLDDLCCPPKQTMHRTAIHHHHCLQLHPSHLYPVYPVTIYL